MGRKANILVVDDSSTVREMIKDTLRRMTGGRINELYEAEEGKEGLDVLSVHDVDLVLCDLVMPGMDGLTFLKEVKEDPEHADIPIVLLTAEESVETKVMGLDAGASDYITKPFEESELIARVRVQLKVKYLQDELKEANRRYRELSITDPLTGISNRRYFFRILDQEFEKAQRYQLPLALLILDIDHFKVINDTFGHLQGDRVLWEFVHLIEKNIRSHDILARYGGEEFGLLLPMADGKTAGKVAEKLCRLIEAHRFEGIDRSKITVSIGACTVPGEGIERVDQWIARADDNLYRAKATGRNRAVINGRDGE